MLKLILKFIYFVPLFAISLIYKFLYVRKDKKFSNTNFKNVKPKHYDHNFFKRDE